MKEKYIIPTTESFAFVCEKIIAQSDFDHMCEESCKHWHFCQDRRAGKICYDKR